MPRKRHVGSQGRRRRKRRESAGHFSAAEGEDFAAAACGNQVIYKQPKKGDPLRGRPVEGSNSRYWTLGGAGGGSAVPLERRAATNVLEYSSARPFLARGHRNSPERKSLSRERFSSRRKDPSLVYRSVKHEGVYQDATTHNNRNFAYSARMGAAASASTATFVTNPFVPQPSPSKSRYGCVSHTKSRSQAPPVFRWWATTDFAADSDATRFGCGGDERHAAGPGCGLETLWPSWGTQTNAKDRAAAGRGTERVFAGPDFGAARFISPPSAVRVGRNLLPKKPAVPKKPVYLRVYDITRGKASRWSDILLGEHVEGVWHTGVLFDGFEYFLCDGIQKMKPENVEKSFAMDLVQTHKLGDSKLTRREFELFLIEQRQVFSNEKYNLTDWNCNHFSQACVSFLLPPGRGRGELGGPLKVGRVPDYIMDQPKKFMANRRGRAYVWAVKNVLAKAENYLDNVFETEMGNFFLRLTGQGKA